MRSPRVGICAVAIARPSEFAWSSVASGACRWLTPAATRRRVTRNVARGFSGASAVGFGNPRLVTALAPHGAETGLFGGFCGRGEAVGEIRTSGGASRVTRYGQDIKVSVSWQLCRALCVRRKIILSL